MEHEIPEHAQTIIMPSTLKQLKATTGERTTKDALSESVSFLLNNKEQYREYKKNQRKVK